MYRLITCFLCLLLSQLAVADDDDRSSVMFSGSWIDRPATSQTKTAAKAVGMQLLKSSDVSSSSYSSAGNRVVQMTVNVSDSPVAKLLGFPSYASMQEQRRKVLKNGAIVVRWQIQYYNISAYGNMVTAKFEVGGKLSGKFKGNPNSTISAVDSVPRFKEGDAVARVAKALGLTVDNGTDYLIKNVKVKRILKFDDVALRLQLCYRVAFIVEWKNRSAAPLAPHGIVNAMTGVLIAAWNGIQTQSIATTISGVGGNSGRGGVSPPVIYVDVPVTRSANGRCSYDGSIVQVQNMNGFTAGAFAVATFACSDATNASYDKVNGGYSPMNDVARNAAVTVRMYQNYLGFNGPTGTLPVRARVHYGTNYENAFYDGVSAYFGDGSLSLYPLTSLEVVAHEFSHGFTHVTSGLEYYGQSGAISESFSDMAGVTAVYYDTGKTSFTFGSGITKVALPLRSLCNPRSDGRSIDHVTQYRNGMDVHYSSGLYNKVFCILATQWDVITAFQLFAYTNAFYWGQLTTFVSGACGVMRAAVDMGVSTATVAAAFNTVGLACPNN